MSYIGNPGSNKTLTTNANGILQGSTTSGGGPGSRTAIDSNHQLVYYCDETSGTTLANLGSVGSGANLALTGTYALASKGLFLHGTNAILFTAQTGLDGAFASGLSFSMGSSFTIEAVVTYSSVPNFGDGNSNTNKSHIIEISNGTDYAFLTYSGSQVSGDALKIQGGILIASSLTYVGLPAPAIGPIAHVAVKKDSTSLTFFLNGAACNTTTVTSSGFGSNATKVAIGNSTSGSTVAFRGHIAEVRLSDIARSDSYILTAAKTALGL